MTHLDKPLRIVLAHGSRNEIFLAEGDPTRIFDGPEQAADFVRALNDRTGPFGGDGIYFFVDGDVPRAFFFNPDGSPAALCGNGLRVLGRLLLERHAVPELPVRIGDSLFRVRTAASPAPGVAAVAIDLPEVTTEAARVPIVTGAADHVDQVIPELDPRLRFTALAVPNTHIVAIVDDYDEGRLIEIGERVARTRAGGALPEGANVSFLYEMGDAEVFVRTFERGAGLTPSCGSGVVASRTTYSLLTGLARDRRVVVRNVGGPAGSWAHEEDGRWSPVLEGNATDVYAVELTPAALMAGEVPGDRVRFAEETDAFERLCEGNLARLAEAGIKTA